MSVARRASAEFAGTGLLVAAVVGSGIAAARLSPDDAGLQLLENAIATALALGALILTFGPISGAHFNPVVSAVDWWLGRRTGTGLTAVELVGYIAAQATGAVAGAVLADVMFGLPAVAWSHTDRDGGHLWLAEVVATYSFTAEEEAEPDRAGLGGHDTMFDEALAEIYHRQSRLALEDETGASSSY